MGKFLKDNYYVLIRIMLVLSYSVYGFMEMNNKTGVSVRVLLLVSFYITLVTLKELVNKNKRLILFAAAAVVTAALLFYGGNSFLLLAILLCFELLAHLKAKYYLYFIMYMWMFADNPTGYFTEFTVITMLIIFYLQHEYVVAGYEAQMYEDIIAQQGLKRDYEAREYEVKAEMKKNMLQAENRILEERAELSQTLHDKLGHNINGSVYQLEAAKVIMEAEPEKARAMIQSVIDRLRSGMDEIRAILRKERPEKKKMALLQIYELCNDCNNKGVEAELSTEGDLSGISAELWEVILDNTFEAVTNSMKYSKCKKIDIKIVVMNELVRCTVSDDGKGCEKLVDGMGISGMRRRVRNSGGTVNFETEAGFAVNMLLPL